MNENKENTNENMDNKFYTCRYDRVFKEIMSKESNRDILVKILECILNLNITEIEVNNIERNSGNLKIKRKNVDALLTTNEGKIQIEVNAFNKKYVHPRNTAYICDIYSHHTLVGDKYNEDTKIIQINLSYEINDNKAIRIYRLQDEEGKRYVKNLIIYDVNMEYYKKIWYSGNEKKINENKYLIMMDLGEEELKEISKNDKVVTKYMEDLRSLNKNPEFREYMTLEEDLRKIHNTELDEAKSEAAKEAMEQGLEKGIEKGEKNKSIDIARNMLKGNEPIDKIMLYTGLTKEELESLR